MATQAKLGAGTQLKVGDGATPEVFTLIDEVKDMTGPTITLPEVDVSNMDSTADEYIGGLPNSGAIQFSVNFNPTNSRHTQLMSDSTSGTKRNYQVRYPQFSPAKTFSFAGIVTKFDIKTQVKNAITADCSIRISGAVTIS